MLPLRLVIKNSISACRARLSR